MNSPNRLTTLPMPRVAVPRGVARAIQHTSAASAIRKAVDIPALWRETVAIFGTNAGPVLVNALIRFAAVSAAVEGVRALTGLTPVSRPWVFILCSAVGLPLYALCRGALVWIGLHGNDRTTGLSQAAATGTALARWRMLLPGSLLQAVLTFFCALGLTPLLLSSGLGVPDRFDIGWFMDIDEYVIHIEPVYPNPDGMPRLVTSRGIDAAVLGPLQPLSELLTPTRTALLRLIWQPDTPAPAEVKTLMFQLSIPLNPPMRSDTLELMAGLPSELIGLASLALLVAAETLLRFCVPAAVRAEARTAPTKRSIFGPVLESARLTLRYPRLVILNAGMLRLIVTAVQILCIILPTSVAENVVVPQLAQTAGAPWLVPLCRLMCGAGSAAVAAILVAFCALYDARLYAALTCNGQFVSTPSSGV